MSKAMDRVLTWFTRALFLYLVMAGFVLYTRNEWMMWR